jgi:hypothetical protein
LRLLCGMRGAMCQYKLVTDTQTHPLRSILTLYHILHPHTHHTDVTHAH